MILPEITAFENLAATPCWSYEARSLHALGFSRSAANWLRLYLLLSVIAGSEAVSTQLNLTAFALQPWISISLDFLDFALVLSLSLLSYWICMSFRRSLLRFAAWFWIWHSCLLPSYRLYCSPFWGRSSAHPSGGHPLDFSLLRHSESMFDLGVVSGLETQSRAAPVSAFENKSLRCSHRLSRDSPFRTLRNHEEKVGSRLSSSRALPILGSHSVH